MINFFFFFGQKDDDTIKIDLCDAKSAEKHASVFKQDSGPCALADRAHRPHLLGKTLSSAVKSKSPSPGTPGPTLPIALAFRLQDRTKLSTARAACLTIREV